MNGFAANLAWIERLRSTQKWAIVYSTSGLLYFNGAM